MHQVTTTLLILATIGSSYGQRPNFNCDTGAFNTCANTLASKLGVSSNNIFQEMFLYNALYDKFTTGQGLGDVVNLCNTLTNFYACVGVDQIGNCMSPLGWVNQGIPPAQAYHLDGTLRQWAYICGVGLDLFTDSNSYDCIRRTWNNNYRQLIDGALYPYMQNIFYDPANACNYTLQLQKAWSELFFNSPICYNDQREYSAGFFGCATQLEYTSAQFSHCMKGNTCEWKVNWTVPSFYIKTINDVKHLRVVPYWQKDNNGKLYRTEETWIPLNF